MRPQLAAVADTQGGIFTRTQALVAGYTPREIKALTRPGGAWIMVRYGFYCTRSLLEPKNESQRWLLKDRAALLGARRAAVLSHDSAARALDIAQLTVDQPGSHLTLFGPNGCRSTGGVTRHRDLLPLCTEFADGLPTTSYARTAIDVGRLHGFLNGVVAVDSVRNRGVPLADLEAELARMERHPHIARACAAVAASDSGAESVLETLGRQLVAELGIGEVETQFAVGLSGGRVVWCDIRVSCHLFECDGFIKLVHEADGGVATDPAAEVLWREKQRQTEICAEGFGVSRIYWSDCFGGRDRAKARLRKEYAVTQTRFGRELPDHLRRFADAHPRHRPTRLWLPGMNDVA